MSWSDHFLAFDVETSGFHKEARVLELAIVEFVCGEPHQAETFLFSPPDLDWEDERTKQALAVNGLDPDELRRSPPFEFRIERVQQCLSWAPIWVAHNTAFDIRMLDREFTRLGLPAPRPPDLLACTLSFERHLRQASRTTPGFKLAEVAERRGITIGSLLHRAHVDATLAGRIFVAQAQDLPENLEDVQRVAGTAWVQQSLLRLLRLATCLEYAEAASMPNPYFKASATAKPHLVRPGGLKGEIFKLCQELEAAFDQLAGGGGGDLVLFTGDGSPQSGATFGKWSDLMNYTSALQAAQSGLKPRIRFTAPFTLPSAGMPPTGWPTAQATWESTVLNTGVISVTIPPGVSVDMLQGLTNGIGLICNPSVDGETFKFSQIPPGAGPQILGCANGSTITHNISTKALVATAGAVAQTYFVFAASGCTWLTPLSGPLVKASGGDVVIGSMVIGGFQGVPDGWAESSDPGTLLLYQDNISASFPLVSWAGFILEMFNGTDNLQMNMRHGTLADRAALAALPGGYALKVGTTFFATDYGPNGGQLIWTGSVWVDGAGAIVP